MHGGMYSIIASSSSTLSGMLWTLDNLRLGYLCHKSMATCKGEVSCWSIKVTLPYWRGISVRVQINYSFLRGKNNETSLPELFHNYLFLRFLQKEKLVGSKFRYAFCHCFLFFSFFCYLFFGHHSEWHYNAVNFTIDRILSRVKKQYSRVINNLTPTAFSVPMKCLNWTLIKVTRIC